MPPPKGTPNPIEGPGDYTTTTQVHSDTYPAISPLLPTNSLLGKSILITGASKGIGRAISVAYARAGASFLALGARSGLEATIEAVEKAAKEAGREKPRILAVKVDVGDEGSVRDAAELVGKELPGGRLDVVVNNAGILDGRGKVGEGQGEIGGWWRNFEINLRGPYLIANAFLPFLLKSESKTLVTVASVGAHCVNAGLSGYQTSKLAVVRLMEFIAAEYADQGVTAISVHPGNILTEIVGYGEGMSPELKAAFTETPELCADSLVYLTKESRPWLSGRYINVTWDLPELTSDPKKTEIIEEDKLKVILKV